MIYYKQTAIAATGVAQALGADIVNKPAVVKAFSTNAAVAYLGDEDVTTATGFELAKGTEVRFKWLGDLSKIYVVGTKDDKICIISIEE